MARAYARSFEIARVKGIRTLAFSCISTGVYGYPKKEAAETAVVVAGQFLLTECPNTEVIFCVFDDETRGIYEGLLGKCAEDAEIWQ